MDKTKLKTYIKNIVKEVLDEEMTPLIKELWEIKKALNNRASLTEGKITTSTNITSNKSLKSSIPSAPIQLSSIEAMRNFVDPETLLNMRESGTPEEILTEDYEGEEFSTTAATELITKDYSQLLKKISKG